VSVLECIACGTPVIATDIDGLPEAVGNAGIIVRPGSAPALLEAMNEITATPGILSGMRQQCQYERGHMQSWDAMGAAWTQLLTG
jgi:glycosyltransferase involved in cell wall biosynthesis